MGRGVARQAADFAKDYGRFAGVSRLAAAAALALAGLGAPPPAAAQTIPQGNGSLPGMKFYDAEALTPAAAKQNYYDGAGSSASYAWGSQKPWEITAAAAALENDPQKIFAFVKNYVRFEPRFGAQKGAIGAVIDRSGTAFDQAQLLVELLRAAGHSANYRIGTITLSGTEFVDWLGISDPVAARQFLANGGIPAEVTGSGSISQVTMAHAWVQTTINGSTIELDPSYKRMQRWTPINVVSESSLSTAGMAAPTGSGSENGVAYATGIDLAAIKTSLDAASVTLLGKLKTTYKDKRSEEIYGGERIIFNDNPWATKTTGTLSADWGTYSGGLPDKFRTKVTVGSGCQMLLFADEIYGRRLSFLTTHYEETQAGPHQLGVNALVLNGLDISTVGLSTQISGCPPLQAPSGRVLTIDLPYAARSGGVGAYGTWMDRAIVKAADRGGDIVLGWGMAASELQPRLADDFQFTDPSSIPNGTPPRMAGEYYGPPQSGVPAGPPVGPAKMYAAWLAQMTRATELLQGVSQTRIQHHYTAGLVYDQIQGQVHDINNNNWADPGEPLVVGAVQDTATRMDIDSGFSVTSLTNSATDKVGVRHTVAAFGAMLEGSIFEQQNDAVDTASTAQRFPWAQENLASTIRYHQLLPGSPALTDYRAGATPDRGVACKGQDMANLGSGSAGYAVIQPNDRYLGPGTIKAWNIPPGLYPYVNRAPQSDNNMQRGCAWIAFNEGGSEIAHLVTSVDRAMKGSGGASNRDAVNQGPPAQGDLLKDQFRDRSSIGGVDLRTGFFTYRPDPDLVVGQGEFPYSLSFQRVFQAGGATCPKCVSGWTHNLDVRATVSGGGLEGMGQTTPLALASPLVGLRAAFELYRAAPSAIGTHLAGATVMRWIGDRLTYNVVTVNQGASSETFVRVADRNFVAPPGSPSKLEVTGERVKYDDTPRRSRSPVWRYEPMTLRRISGSGDRIDFKWIESNPSEIVPNDYGALHANAQGFFADKWTFPQGVELSFSYCTDAPIIYGGEPGISQVTSLALPCADRLKKVSSNLGVYLDIDRLNVASSDGRATFVTRGTVGLWQLPYLPYPVYAGAPVVTGAIDVAGKRREYEWTYPSLSGRPSAFPRLVRVMAPVDYTGSVDAVDDNVVLQAGVDNIIKPLVNDKPLSGLRIFSVTQPVHGRAQFYKDTAIYTPAAGYTGSDSFQYTAIDQDGARDTATIFIHHTPPANRPPTAANVHYVFHRVAGTFPPGVAVADPISQATDPDGDALAFAPGGMPADFVAYQGNRLEYKNTTYTYGTPRVYIYKITDGRGGESQATISVEVPNRAPSAPSVTHEWDVSIGNAWVQIPFMDLDGDPVSIISTSNPNAVINSAGNAIRYTGAQVGGHYVFQYTVSDGVNQSTGTIDLTVVNTDGCRIGQICN